MRNKISILQFIGVATIFLVSCRKDAEQEKQADSVVVSSVNLWLDSKRPIDNTMRANNVEMLKNSLDFSKLRYEILSEKEKFLIIPISNKYKEVGRFEQNSILNLLLVIDESGIIKRGNISEYIPEHGIQASELSLNSFSNLYNNKIINSEGAFKFLSIGGRWLYQYTFKNGKFSSVALVKPDSSSPNNSSSRTTGCTKWYWVTTYYNSNGEVIDEVWQYIGTTCTGSGGVCSDPLNASLCPDMDSGGDATENTCCITDPNAQLTVSNGYEADWVCADQGLNPISGNLTKKCTVIWNFQRCRLLFYSWGFISKTIADFEKVAGEWQFITTSSPLSPSFEGVTLNGQLPPCVSSRCESVTPNLSVGANKKSGTLILSYTIETKVTCLNWGSPRYDYGTVQATLIPPA
jgi:hypothetical protein